MKSSFRWAILSLALLSVEAWAQMSACATSGGAITSMGNCWAQPESYTLTVYELGLCTSEPSAPTTSAAAGVSSCSKVYDNPTGSEVTIVGGVGIPPAGTFTRPPNGSYTHGYVVIGNALRINSSFTFSASRTRSGGGAGTKCWTKEGTVYGGNNLQDVSFECGNTVSGQGTIEYKINTFAASPGTYTNNVPGIMTAHLVTNSLVLGAEATATGNGTITRVLGVVPMAVTMSEATTSMNLAIKTTTGSTLAQTGGNISYIGGGPFQVVLTLQ